MKTITTRRRRRVKPLTPQQILDLLNQEKDLFLEDKSIEELLWELQEQVNKKEV